MAMLDTVDWPIAFLGCLKAGVIAVPVNTLLTEDDYRFMLADSRAKCLVVSEALFPKFEKLIKDSPDLEHVIVSGDNPHGYRLFEDVIGADEPEPYTAPTTERRHGVLALHLGLHRQAEGRGACACQLEAHRRSLRHAGRRPEGKRRRLFGGETVFRLRPRQRHDVPALGRRHHGAAIGDRPTPDGVAALLRKHPVTVFFAVPTFYAAFLASPNAPKKIEVEIPPLHFRRRGVAGGNRAHAGRSATASKFPTGSAPPRCCTSISPTRPGATKYGTTGKPVPGYEIKLIGEDGQPVKQGEMGELYARGPTSAIMYWNNREKSRSTFQGEWTRSGDKYIEDADGYYVCCGRADDMLKVSGMYVSPFEVEAALSSHPDVLEAAVVGWGDEQKLVKPKAFVVLKEPDKASDALIRALQEHVKAKLAPYQISALDRIPHRAAEDGDRQDPAI